MKMKTDNCDGPLKTGIIKFPVYVFAGNRNLVFIAHLVATTTVLLYLMVLFNHKLWTEWMELSMYVCVYGCGIVVLVNVDLIIYFIFHKFPVKVPDRIHTIHYIEMLFWVILNHNFELNLKWKKNIFPFFIGKSRHEYILSSLYIDFLFYAHKHRMLDLETFFFSIFFYSVQSLHTIKKALRGSISCRFYGVHNP